MPLPGTPGLACRTCLRPPMFRRVKSGRVQAPSTKFLSRTKHLSVHVRCLALSGSGGDSSECFRMLLCSTSSSGMLYAWRGCRSVYAIAHERWWGRTGLQAPRSSAELLSPDPLSACTRAPPSGLEVKYEGSCAAFLIRKSRSCSCPISPFSPSGVRGGPRAVARVPRNADCGSPGARSVGRALGCRTLRGRGNLDSPPSRPARSFRPSTARLPCPPSSPIPTPRSESRRARGDRHREGVLPG